MESTGDSSKRNTQPSKTWWSLQRLQDSGIMFGAGTLQSTCGSRTKLGTHKIMAAVTCNTMREILRRGWPG